MYIYIYNRILLPTLSLSTEALEVHLFPGLQTGLQASGARFLFLCFFFEADTTESYNVYN